MSELLRVSVITPVFNDWQCLESLLGVISDIQDDNLCVTVLVIDDGSTEPLPTDLESPVGLKASVISLASNVGHQRAIAVGLVDSLKNQEADFYVVIDADGEDDPTHIVQLINACREYPGSVAVAQRRKRVASKRFIWLYATYKLIFRAATGKRLDFGNFVVMTPGAAARVCAMPELWNHFPATIMKSKLEIVRVPLHRAARYFGNSRMNFTSLINHGLAGLSVFANTFFIRLLLLISSITLILGIAIGAGVFLRISLGVPIPGWLALTVLFAAIGLLQLLSAVFIVGFLNLSSRSSFAPPPNSFTESLVSGRKHLIIRHTSLNG